MRSTLESHVSDSRYSQSQYGIFIVPDGSCDTDHVIDTVVFPNDTHEIVVRRSEFEKTRGKKEKFDQVIFSRYYVSYLEMWNAVMYFENSTEYIVNSIRDSSGEAHNMTSMDTDSKNELYIDAFWVTNSDGQTIMIDRRGNIDLHSSNMDVDNDVINILTEFVFQTKEPLCELAEVYDDIGIKTIDSQRKHDVSFPAIATFEGETTRERFEKQRKMLYSNQFRSSTIHGETVDSTFNTELIDMYTYNRYRVKIHGDEMRIFSNDLLTLNGILQLVNMGIDIFGTCPHISAD